MGATDDIKSIAPIAQAITKRIFAFNIFSAVILLMCYLRNVVHASN
jgi:hypothetical protein